MIQQDTVRLLRQCDSGIKMGVSAIDEVMQYVDSLRLQALLTECRKSHEHLAGEAQAQLHRFQDEGKEPGLMAKSMSWLKTNWKMTVDQSDQTIADLITDGCNEAVKTLNQYLHQYQAADEASKGLTKQLIRLEEETVKKIRPFL